jgi:hypothetical protein
MKTEVVRPRDKVSPIVEIDEFWSPAWEIDAVEASLFAPGYRSQSAHLHESFERFDD